MEWCFAYCDDWTAYFNYSSTSGKGLTLDEIVDISGEFGAKIQKDRQNQYRYHMDGLKKLLEEGEIGEIEYVNILERFVECKNEFEPENFSILNGEIRIFETCWLHQSQKPLVPMIKLDYKVAEFGDDLKIRELLNHD